MTKTWQKILFGAFPFFFVSLIALFPLKKPFWAFQSIPLLPLFLFAGGLFFILLILFFPEEREKRFEAGLASLLRPAFSAKGIFFMAGGVTIILYLVRMRLFLPPPNGLGDSVHLVEYVPVFSHLFGYLGSFDEILELYWHSLLYLWLNEQFGLGALYSYQILSLLAGFFYIILIGFRIRKDGVNLLNLALFLAVPGMQLYAGYVENYTLAALFLAILFHTGSLLLESPPASKSREFWSFFTIGGIGALGALHHMVIGFAGPALIYLVYSRAKGFSSRFFRLSAAAVFAATLVFALVWSYFLLIHPNPISPGTSFALRPAIYPLSRLISLTHILELLGLLFLASPPLFYWLFQFKSPIARLRNGTPSAVFVWIGAASFFFHAFIWNPMIGFPADWDLFTFFHIPLNLAVYLSLRNSKTRLASWTLTGGLLFGLLVTTPWLLRNHEESVKSRRTLEVSEHKVETFLESIAKDEIYERIPNLARKRAYVEARLFATGAELQFAGMAPEKRSNLPERLDAAMANLKNQVLLPEEEFRTEFQRSWDILAEINVELARLENAED